MQRVKIKIVREEKQVYIKQVTEDVRTCKVSREYKISIEKKLHQISQIYCLVKI